MIRLYAPSIFDASERNTPVITLLTLIPSRLASSEMVDGGLHRCHNAINEEDALRH
jgi:hypothetical protein